MSVTLFHHPVSFEKGNIVGRAFHARHDAVLVVELDTGRPHLMTDAGPLNASAEVVAGLALPSARELAARKVATWSA